MTQSLLRPITPPSKPKLIKRRSVDSQLPPATAGMTSSRGASWDRSASQPDISVEVAALTEVQRLSPTLETAEMEAVSASTGSLSDQLESLEATIAEPQPIQRPLVEKITEFSESVTTYLEGVMEAADEPAAAAEPAAAVVVVETLPDEMVSSTDKMNEDIDIALAEVMSNLHALTGGGGELPPALRSPTEPASPPPSRCTPDLVQDLPLVDSTSDSDQASPVGSFKQSPPPIGCVKPTNQEARRPTLPLLSAAETFASSEANTIVRLKSPTSPTATVPNGQKFIGASFTKPHALSSFSRSISVSSACSPRDDKPNPFKPKVATITGNAIQVRAPSIPSLAQSVTSDSQDVNTEAASNPTRSSGDAVKSRYPKVSGLSLYLSKDMPLNPKPTDQENGTSDPPMVVKKVPPPIKAKPKPPAPPPKPKKSDG